MAQLKRGKTGSKSINAALKAQGGTPVAAVAAAGTLTFSGVVADGQTVTIGDDVYEFDTNSSVTAGRIAVDVSGGATAPDAVTALVAAITADGTELLTAVDGAGDTVVVTMTEKGSSGNAITLAETCTNGSWDHDHLQGGVDGTEGPQGTILVDGTNIYVATTDCTKTGGTWRKVAHSAL